MKKHLLIGLLLFSISQSQALRQVQNLPEVKAYKKEVETSKLKGKFILREEQTTEGGALYEFYIGEGLSDHTARWNTFGVDKKSGEIFVFDMMRGKYIPYARWKKTLP